MRRVLAGAAGVGLAVAVAGLGSCGAGSREVGLRGVAADDAPGTAAYYTTRVRPILVRNCGRCHFNVSHKGGLSLETKASTMKGGHGGVVIVPGDPANSLLVKLVRHEGPANDPKPMPPKSPKMSDADIAVIVAWVKAGAVMPNDRAR